MASSSALVGLSGSFAAGRLPNFSRQAISRNRALLAVRLVAAIWKSVGSAKPMGAPRPVHGDRDAAERSLEHQLVARVRRRPTVRHQPLNDEAGEQAETELVLDRGDQVDFRRGVVSVAHPGVAAVGRDGDDRNGVGRGACRCDP